ncbi:MAG TPA: hypothetical protein VMU47_00795 [Caldimonas sp.]|nr:hypothetical protein [Caldimonas sp.]
MPDSPARSNREAPGRAAQPYLDWALATGFRYLREGQWIPLLIEFDAKEAVRTSRNERLNALGAFVERTWLSNDPERELNDKFIVPELFGKPEGLLSRQQKFNFCVALIRRDVDVVRSLTARPGWQRTIVRLDIGPPVDLGVKPAPAQASPKPAPAVSQPSTPPQARHRTSLLARAGALLQRVMGWMGSPFRAARRKEPEEPAMPGTAGPTSTSSAPPSAPVSSSPPNKPTPPDSGTPPVPPPTASPGGPLAGGSSQDISRVVIAVIDEGLAFANSRFVTAGAPRVEYLWQQNVLGTAVPSASQPIGTAPGYELDKNAIQNALAATKDRDAGEDWLYQTFGGLNFAADCYKPLARRKSHGTHVLDLAAGDMPGSQYPIIAVDMPEAAVGDPAASTLSVQAAWGLIYVLDRAARLLKGNETLPVVANLSYGPTEGPHDGTGILEAFMDQISQLANSPGSRTPLEIVLAAGNSRQARMHAALNLHPAQPKHLQWRLQPGSLSPSVMEIWLPPQVGDHVTVTLTPPFAPAALPPISVSLNHLTDEFPQGGNDRLYWAQYVPATAPRTDSILLVIARTAPDPDGLPGDAVAPSGVWDVTLTSQAAVQGVNAWIKRADTLPGRRAKGRQSYLDDPKYSRFHRDGRPRDFDPHPAGSYVRRVQTLSGIATGALTRIIGGYRQSDFYPALYSSHGTRLLGKVPVGPDWLTCSDESEALTGVHGAGTRSGSVVAMNGTSAAAPQAARWIATEWLASGARPTLPNDRTYPPLLPNRPIPVAEQPFAFGGGFARFEPRWPPRRDF